MNTPTRPPWLMLFSRIVLFFAIQALLALGFTLAGSTKGWDDSVAWWTLVVTFTDLIGVFTLIKLFQREGKNYWDIFGIERKHLVGDLLTLFGAMFILGPAALLPNILLSTWLYGDPQAVLAFFVRPLPMWAVYLVAIILFPISQGLAELATYFKYVMPRLEANGMATWLAVALTGLMLGVQHLAAPFVFDIRFITWRGLMFIPFGILTGILLHWRPRLFPYAAIIHVLMNMSFATMFLAVAY
jgi:hypothetical protein